MFKLSSIFSGLELWSVDYTWIFQHFESKVFKNIKFLIEISNNWTNYLLGTNVYKTLESSWQSFLTLSKCTNTTSVISKWGKFSPFLS